MSFQIIQEGQGSKRDVVLCYLIGDKGPVIAREVGPEACVVAQAASSYAQYGEVIPWQEAIQQAGGGTDFEVARIWLIGFSAGCQAVRLQLNNGCPASVVIACDGIHGDKPQPADWQVAPWRKLANRARAGEVVFSVSCSKTPTTTFLSTEDMAKYTFGWNGCYGSYSSPCVDQSGLLRIYGATNGGGDPKQEHLDQIRNVLPLMIRDAKSSSTIGMGMVAVVIASLVAIWWGLT